MKEDDGEGRDGYEEGDGRTGTLRDSEGTRQSNGGPSHTILYVP